MATRCDPMLAVGRAGIRIAWLTGVRQRMPKVFATRCHAPVPGRLPASSRVDRDSRLHKSPDRSRSLGLVASSGGLSDQAGVDARFYAIRTDHVGTPAPCATQPNTDPAGTPEALDVEAPATDIAREARAVLGGPAGQPTIFARERDMLREAGCTRVSDNMVPPS